MSRTAAIILAAGAARRFGSAKQLARIGGETLLERSVRIAQDAGCIPLVILGAHAEEILAACVIAAEHLVINPLWDQGMATSILAGVKRSGDLAAAALLMTCDQPFVTSAHLRELIAQGERSSEPAASSYAGRNGVPAYFPATSVHLLLGLSGDVGARSLLAETHAIPLEYGELDIDTLEEMLDAQKLFAAMQN